MNRYSAPGNGTSNVSPQACLWTGLTKPFRITGFTFGFETPTSGGAPPGLRPSLVNTMSSGTGWANSPVPIALDPASPGAYAGWGYGGAGVPPITGGVFVTFPLYYKGLINWQAKKGKEISPAMGVGCALLISGAAGFSLNIDYCFQFEE